MKVNSRYFYHTPHDFMNNGYLLFPDYGTNLRLVCVSRHQFIHLKYNPECEHNMNSWKNTRGDCGKMTRDIAEVEDARAIWRPNRSREKDF